MKLPLRSLRMDSPNLITQLALFRRAVPLSYWPPAALQEVKVSPRSHTHTQHLFFTHYYSICIIYTLYIDISLHVTDHSHCCDYPVSWVRCSCFSSLPTVINDESNQRRAAVYEPRLKKSPQCQWTALHSTMSVESKTAT